MFYINKLCSYNDINADIIVFDSSGKLLPLPNCKVVHLLNIEHGIKMDQAIKRIFAKYIWITDDDIFFDRLNLKSILLKLDSSEREWVYSVVPRGQTVISNDGFEQRAIGSYSIIFKREIFLKENFSFKVRPIKDDQVNWGRGYYDTCDYAHKISLDRGYRAIISDHEEETLTFFGTSIAYLKFISSIKTKSQFMNWVSENNDLRRVSEKIGSTYCLLKIFNLNNIVFGDCEKYSLPINEDDLTKIIDTLDQKDAAVRARELLQKYEAVYKRLINVSE